MNTVFKIKHPLIKLIIIFFTLLITNQQVCAQQILLEETLTEDTIGKSNYGANRKHFVHTFFSIGFLLGNTNDKHIKITYGASHSFNLGLRYKYKLNNQLSLLTELYYRTNNYVIQQNANKQIPDNITHNSQSLKNYNIGFAGGLRFNFDKNRGDNIGKYADIGVAIDYPFEQAEITKDKINHLKVKTITKGLTYFTDYNIYALLRLNLFTPVIFYQYRITSLFKSSTNFPDLAKHNIGVQFDLIFK